MVISLLISCICCIFTIGCDSVLEKLNADIDGISANSLNVFNSAKSMEEVALDDIVKYKECNWNAVFELTDDFNREAIVNSVNFINAACFSSEKLTTLINQILSQEANPDTDPDIRMKDIVTGLLGSTDVFIHGGAIRDLLAGTAKERVKDIDMYFENFEDAKGVCRMIFQEQGHPLSSCHAAEVKGSFAHIKYVPDSTRGGMEGIEGSEWRYNFMGDPCKRENSVNSLLFSYLNGIIVDPHGGRGVYDIIHGQVTESCNDIDGWLKNGAIMRAFKMPKKGFRFTPDYENFIIAAMNKVAAKPNALKKECVRQCKKLNGFKGDENLQREITTFMKDHIYTKGIGHLTKGSYDELVECLTIMNS